MKKVRMVVSFSGGKDSQATLIYVCNKYGAQNVEAAFCDTGWEHPVTITHINEVCEQLGVKLHVLRSKRHKDFQEMCLTSGTFPLATRRFCTAQLKVEPMIDWVLEQDDNFMIFQGIRAGESKARAKMEAECMYFKEYFDKSAKGLYRKKAVLEWCKTHDASLFRPIFRWSAQQVIDYILDNGQQPNPLYKQGAARVGCFPCIMARHSEVRIVAKDKEMRERLINLEEAVNAKKGRKKATQFFVKGYIPARFCKKYGNSFPSVQEVLDYVTRDDVQLDMFEPEGGYSCMSMYHGLCE